MTIEQQDHLLQRRGEQGQTNWPADQTSVEGQQPEETVKCHKIFIL